MHGSPRRASPAGASALGACLITGVLLGVGCQPTGESAYGRNGVSAIQFADVPVPSDFRLDDRWHKSDSREEGRWRYGNFFYYGTASVADASAYLIEQMPRHNWQLAGQDTNEEGTVRNLTFRRGNYRAHCKLTRGETKTELAVEYRTLGAGGVKK